MSDVHVRIADMAVGHNGSVITTVGLGSCVAIVLYDRGQRVGGMAHIMLPDSEAFSSERAANRAKFANTAVPYLMEALAAAGARNWALEAKIAGGSQLFAWGGDNSLNIGERNITAARQALERARVPLVGEDVGGGHGRTVKLEVATGTLTVHTSKREVREV